MMRGLLVCLSAVRAMPSAISDPSVSLHVSPTGAVVAGQAVTVTWTFGASGAARPGDFIGAFAPSGAHGAPNVSGVTARQCLSAACRDSRLVAQASVVFPALVHSRTNYSFLYFSPQRCAGCWDVPALAASHTLQFADANEPTGVHLSLSGRAGEAIVSFSTLSFSTPAVRYGAAAAGGALTRLSTGTTTSYGASDLCGAPANDSASGDFVPPHALHSVLIGGLIAGEHIDYQAGTVNGSWSKVWRFAMPAVGADASAGGAAYPLRVAMFGDLGQNLAYNDRVGSQPAARATLASILRRDPALVVHTGDISYARGSGSIWPAFFQQAEGVAATRPYLTSIGNHEMDTPTQDFNWTRGPDSGGECGVPYSAHFTNPGHQPPGAQTEHWWSLDIGGVHLATLSSEANWTADSAQHKWLAADLAAVNRSRTPFLLVTTHRPFYTSGNGWLSAPYNVGFLAAQRAAIEPLLQQFEVDLVVVGHVHKYERTCRMAASGRCAGEHEHGTVHLVLGAAGEPFQTGCDGCSAWEHVAVEEGGQQRGGGPARQFAAPAWSAFRSLEFGYGLLTLHNASALQVQYVGAKDDVVHDSVWIVKPALRAGRDFEASD